MDSNRFNSATRLASESIHAFSLSPEFQHFVEYVNWQESGSLFEFPFHSTSQIEEFFHKSTRIAALPENILAAFNSSNSEIIINTDLFQKEYSERQIARILTEEFGHWLNDEISDTDAIGDEGKLFADMVFGKALGDALPAVAHIDDHVSIEFDGEIADLQTSSISRSGGFEGSTERLELESSGGGVVRYSYQMFVIPDRMIIRYEGQELLDTGFVSGARSGVVEIPEGQSDFVEIVIATDNVGTAWNYTVSADLCPPTGPYILTASGQGFVFDSTSGQCTADGTVFVGFDGIGNFLRVENAQATYDADGATITGTIVATGASGPGVRLFDGTIQFSFDSNRFSVNSTNDLLDLGGLGVNIEGLALSNEGLTVTGDFSLPVGLGGTNIGLAPGSSLVIDALGARFEGNGFIDFPDAGFRFLDSIDISSSDARLSYDFRNNALKAQGALGLTAPFLKTVDSPELSLDFADPNFIQIQNGIVDVSGEASLRNLAIAPGWKLNELRAEFQTANGVLTDIEGGLKFTFPWPGSASIPPRTATAGIDLGFQLQPQLALDSAGLSFAADVPIGATGFTLRGIDGSVRNLAPTNPNSVLYNGGLDLTYGTPIQVRLPSLLGGATLGGDLVAARVNGQVDSSQLSATGSVTIIDDRLASLSAELDYEYAPRRAQFDGDANLLNGLFVGSALANIDLRSQDFVASAGGTLTLPGSQIVAQIFRRDTSIDGRADVVISNDGNTGNDFIQAYGGQGVRTVGVRVFLMDHLSF